MLSLSATAELVATASRDSAENFPLFQVVCIDVSSRDECR